MMRAVAARIVIAACLVLLVAAGALAHRGGELEARTDAEELRVWLAADYAGEPAILDAIAAFERGHPGVRVGVVGVEWSVLATKLKTATPVGLAPDVAHQHPFVF